jgi:glycyl-tRNA synthetase (class II)
LKEKKRNGCFEYSPFSRSRESCRITSCEEDGLPEKALEIFNVLKYHHLCHYEEKDTIGRRYRRMDAIGTPYCITIDHQTLQDNTVTIRERDTMKQDRIPWKMS